MVFCYNQKEEADSFLLLLLFFLVCVDLWEWGSAGVQRLAVNPG